MSLHHSVGDMSAHAGCIGKIQLLTVAGRSDALSYVILVHLLSILMCHSLGPFAFGMPGSGERCSVCSSVSGLHSRSCGRIVLGVVLFEFAAADLGHWIHDQLRPANDQLDQVVYYKPCSSKEPRLQLQSLQSNLHHIRPCVGHEPADESHESSTLFHLVNICFSGLLKCACLQTLAVKFLRQMLRPAIKFHGNRAHQLSRKRCTAPVPDDIMKHQ